MYYFLEHKLQNQPFQHLEDSITVTEGNHEFRDIVEKCKALEFEGLDTIENLSTLRDTIFDFLKKSLLTRSPGGGYRKYLVFARLENQMLQLWLGCPGKDPVDWIDNIHINLPFAPRKTLSLYSKEGLYLQKGVTPALCDKSQVSWVSGDYVHYIDKPKAPLWCENVTLLRGCVPLGRLSLG